MKSIDKIRNKFKQRGLEIKEVNGRIEVYSQIYEEDTLYQDVTLDTEFEEYKRNSIKLY